MKKKIASLLAFITIAGLTWGLAESVKASKSVSTTAEQNAISVSDDEQCKRTMADCAKHEGMSQEKTSGANSTAAGSDKVSEADCPRKDNCPKGMQKAKSDACCKKPGMGAKTNHAPTSSDMAIAKPTSAAKTKESEVH
jgi:hypothetical protein